MKKLTATDPETHSADVLAGNVEHLKALFPEALTEGKIDFEVLKQLLGTLQLGVISDDLGYSSYRACFIAEAYHDSVGPEPGAVLSDMPAGVLGPARLDREPELMFRNALEIVLGREQNSAGAPNDLAWLIQEDPLGAGIPGLHRAIQAEMEDGIVNRGLEELLITILHHLGTHLGVFPLEPGMTIQQPAWLNLSGM